MSVVGLDIGTSRVKAVRFDPSFTAVDGEGESTKVNHLPGGGREQHMPEVWDAAARVVRAVAARSPDPIDLVAVTAQGDGCWLVDADARPVGPAMLWNDSRAAPVVAGWAADGTLERAFRISGCSAAPGVAHAQLRWLLEHRPEDLDRAQTLISCGGWIHANLTGRLVLEETDAANPFFAAATRSYDTDLLRLHGIAPLQRLLPAVVRGAGRVAPLTASAAQVTGLRAGIPVAMSPYDVAATAFGTGAVAPGDAFAVLGTTLCVGTVHADPRLDRPPNGMTLPGVADGRWIVAHATMSGTEVLDWTAALLGLADAAEVARLAELSEHPAPPLLLPYLSPAGERSPFVDPDVRGSLLGLDLAHRPADLARAALDGLTLAVLDCVEAAGTPTRLALSGGGSRSAAWCQAISDATGVPVVAPDVVEVGARGAVLSAACDVGLLPDPDDAVARHVRPGRVHGPDAAAHDRFRARYERFVTARDALRGG